MMQNRGTVYLVGAGPGSLDLLTIKAHRLIREADVIVYDRLIGSEVLDLIPEGCIKHYVGKKESEHTLPQSEINQLLVTLAHRYKKIVRLKGGDPFVFGRGGEEVEALAEHQIPFEIVPGISSSIAAATYAGIPVTHRGVSNNFSVIAGHTCTADQLDSVNWSAFANVGTLVILMGVKNRQLIATILIEAGRDSATPVAFIENATTSCQCVYTTTLKQLCCEALEIQSPAVMVVGDVVKFHQQWQWFGSNKTRLCQVEAIG